MCLLRAPSLGLRPPSPRIERAETRPEFHATRLANFDLSCSDHRGPPRKAKLAAVILNETTTNVFRYVAPTYNFMLPILVFYNASFGVSGGFTLVSVGAGH